MTGRLRAMAVALALSLAAAPVLLPEIATAAEVSIVVNGTPVTNTDVQRRAAFIRLQQRPGDVRKMAREEMVDQILRLQEANRLQIVVTEKQVADAYANFAKSNGMTQRQMDGVLAQAG